MSSRAVLVAVGLAIVGLVAYLLLATGEQVDAPPVEATRAAGVSDPTPAIPGVRTSTGADEPVEVTHALRGRVQAQGAPVAEAVVTITASEDDAGPPQIVRTDAAGAFESTGLGPGRYAVSATAPGYLAAVQRGVELHADVSVTLTLDEGGHPLRGRVSDATGGAVEGAAVRVTPLAGIASLRRLDGFGSLSTEDGDYVVQVAPGRYRVEVSHADYASQKRTVDVGPGAQSQDFAMVPMGTIAGVVRHEDDNAPVPGAWVTWVRERQMAVAPGRRVSVGGAGGRVQADDQGRYRVRGLAPGAITLQARGAGVVSISPTVVPLAMTEQVTDADVFVAVAHDVRGRVVEQDDPQRPIAGATVSLVDGGRFAPGAQTDAEGRFTLQGVLAGSHTLVASAEGWMQPDAGVSVEAGPNVDEITLMLRHAPVIRGRVEPPTVAEVAIELRPETMRMGMAGRATMMLGGDAKAESDADGNFVLSPAAPGPTTVVARVADGRTGEVEVEVGPDGADQIVIQLEERSTVRGVVRTAGGDAVGQANVALRRRRAAGQAHVRLTVNGRDMGSDLGTSADDGSFEIGGVAAGDYDVAITDRHGEPLAVRGGLAVTPEGIASLKVVQGKDRDGLELVVDAHDGVIRGTVQTASGEGVPDVWVHVAMVPEFMRPAPEPPEGEATERREMRMVVRSDGGSDNSRPPVLTDEQGRFEFRGLRDADYELVAESGGGRQRVTKVAKPGADVTLELADLGTVEGEVTLDGQPLSRFSVQVEGPTSRSMQVRDRGGHFEVGRLDPGRYTLVITAPDGSGRAEVTVGAGETVTQDLDLEHLTSVSGRIVDEQGEPIAGAVILIGAGEAGRVSIEQTGDEEQNTTGEDGRFEVSCAAGPRALVALSPTSPQPLVVHFFVAQAGQAVDVGDLKKREMGAPTQPEPRGEPAE